MKQEEKAGGASRPPRPPPSIRIETADDILGRLEKLYPKLIDLSLGRVQRLLGALGNPQAKLPPVIHVAGTNGKGSTCAFLRAIGEAAGWRVHVATSPHLVRLNERFRIAGTLVADDALISVLAEIERINAGAPITVFEVQAAAGYVLFARARPIFASWRWGSGGVSMPPMSLRRRPPAPLPACRSTTRIFLVTIWNGSPGEKAGIMKPGRPTVTGAHSVAILATLQACADEAGARLLARGRDLGDCSGRRWPCVFRRRGPARAAAARPFRGRTRSKMPASRWLPCARRGWRSGMRLSRVWEKRRGPRGCSACTGSSRPRYRKNSNFGSTGGHNQGAGVVLAAHLDGWRERPTYLVVGMKQSKDASGFLAPLLTRAAGVWAVAEPGAASRHGGRRRDRGFRR